MGSPLDDLRKISSQVEKKKEENIKNRQAHERLEKEMLSEGTLEQKKRRQEKSMTAVKRGQSIKLLAIIFSVLLVAGLIFFIIKFVILAGGGKTTKVSLVSDGFATIDATSPEYSKKKKFIVDFIDKYKLDPKKTEIPWYGGIPVGKKLRYLKIMDEKLAKPGMGFRRVQENIDAGSYQVWYGNETENLIFKIVENEKNELKIVKIF